MSKKEQKKYPWETFAQTHSDTVDFYPSSADYYDAFCKMAATAKKRLIMIGWDLDVRVALQREFKEDGSVDFKNKFGDFLNHLVENNPELEIYLLIWDSPVVFGTEKNNLKNLTFEWIKHKRIHLVFEDPPALAASLHEKYIIIDNTAAFIGGMDITAKRWDTNEHKPYDERRMDPEGNHFLPYHDLQMLLTGKIVHELERLACFRWKDAAGKELKPLKADLDPVFPDDLPKPFHSLSDLDTQIQLTRPVEAVDRKGVFQIEDFYLNALKGAKDLIYIENQYFAHEEVNDILCDHLQNEDGPQIILLIQEEIPELMGKMTVGGKSAQLLHQILDCDKFDKLSIIAPRTEEGVETPVKVHSKVLVVDDDFLSVGTPNINKRSFKLDYEVNLVFAAKNNKQRKDLHSVMLSIIARHANVSTQDVEKLHHKHDKKWHEALKELSENNPYLGWRKKDNISLETTLPQFEDASELMDIEKMTNTLVGISPKTVAKRSMFAFLAIVIISVLIVAGWWLMHHYDGESGRQLIDRYMGYVEDYRPFTWHSFGLGIGIVMLASLFFVPITVPILGFAAFWGAWFGALVVFSGMIIASLIYFFIGKLVGLSFLRRFEGIKIALEKVKDYGVWAVALTRIIPTGPFILVNLATGAIGFKLWEMLVGSVVGFLPGVIIISAFGGQLRNAFQEGSYTSIALVVGIGVLYFVFVRYVVKIARRAMKRRNKKKVKQES